MAKYQSFEELQVYQKSLEFVVNVYKLLEENALLSKDYGIKDQLKRASLSISNNIAEGFERETRKELIRFLYFAKGSAGECRNILNIIYKLQFIDNEIFNKFKNEVFEISQQLGSYIKYLKKLEGTH